MSIVYNENFNSTSVGTSLTGVFYNYKNVCAREAPTQMATVSGLDNMCAQIILPSNNWGVLVYNGNNSTYTYTDISARCSLAERFILYVRAGNTVGDIFPGGGGYGCFVYNNNTWQIIRCDSNGNGNTSLLVGSNPAGINYSDFKIRVRMVGSVLNYFINDIYVGTITDSTWTSGKIGFGLYAGFIAYDNVIVNDITINPSVGGIALV